MRTQRLWIEQPCLERGKLATVAIERGENPDSRTSADRRCSTQHSCSYSKLCIGETGFVWRVSQECSVAKANDSAGAEPTSVKN